ncbi:MAG TPA: TlpA disulfide reductase family protein [Ferruginibacter sp.]|nr:TlpA disulfide reductase family protein [Ferruginibacter sp.]
MIYSFLIIFSVLFGPPTKQPVQVVTLAQLQAKTIQPNNDSLYVVNFWATWCKPCVGELPYFEKAGQGFADKKVRILLVSLDFLSQQEKVDQFVEKNNIQSDVYLLQAGDPNVWINKIDNSWSGEIPATVIYKNGKKLFFREGDFSTQQELDSVIQTNLK